MSLRESGLVSADVTSLIELEKLLFEAGAYPDVTQGVFYMLAICSGDVHFIRFIECGSYIGFLHNTRCNADILDDIQGPAYRVYTEADIRRKAAFLVQRKESISYKRSANPESSKSTIHLFICTYSISYKFIIELYRHFEQVF